jgi:hypothetical protein
MDKMGKMKYLQEVEEEEEHLLLKKKIMNH